MLLGWCGCRCARGGEGDGETVHLPQQAVEFQILQAAAESGGIHGRQRQPGFLRQRDVHQDFRQLAGEISVVPIAAQLSLQGSLDRTAAGLRTFRFHLGEGHVDGIEIAVLLQQVDGGFGSHPTNAGDVVGAVAGEGLQVHHLLRHHPELADHTLLIDQRRAAVLGVRAASHVQNGDVPLVVHQLEQVAVAGEDPHPPTLFS